MKFSRTVFSALAVILGIILCGPSDAAAEADCKIAETAFETARDIRGLAIRRDVPCRLRNRTQVEEYLREAIGKKIPQKRLEGEERAYKLIGFFDKSYDYTNGLIALYTDQIGGYYDPEKKYYAMAAWMPEIVQMPIAVHELTHALQDQHFDLEKFIDEKQMFGDPLLARSALLEGDATAVMLDFTRRLQGKGSIAEDQNVSAFIVQNLAGTMLSPGLTKAPPALQALLIFPYISGLNFSHKLLRSGGYPAVDRAYKNPPRSTEEILHPEKYGGPQDFIDLPTPTPPEGIEVASREPAFVETEGEFVISVLLRTYLTTEESSAAAAGWGGDRIALFDRVNPPSGDLGIVVWDTAWDTEPDAKQFFDAIVKAYQKRYDAEPEGGDNRAVFKTKDYGDVRVELHEQKVKITAGL